MDQLARYRALVQEVICRSPYCRYGSNGPGEETVFIRDETSDTYMLMDIGWRDREHIVNPFLIVRIRNGKIWIEEDWTEEGITDELLRAGVPKEDIVLGFQHPSMRPYTDFAVA